MVISMMLATGSSVVGASDGFSDDHTGLAGLVLWHGNASWRGRLTGLPSYPQDGPYGSRARRHAIPGLG